jgi:long-chain acyl-CoA synthetase
LLRLPESTRAAYDVSSLEYVVHGAAPCPRWAKAELIKWFGPIVWEYYGAVEGTGPFLCDSATWLERPGTVGRPPPHFEVWVEDAEGHPVGPGEIGELHFRNARGFPVYFNDPDKTAATVRSDHSYAIGDYGSCDSDGFFYIADRRVDMILSGGVNIYPAEIEGALTQHPSVCDAAVVGLDDDEWGQRAHAVVVLEPGAPITAEALDAHCRKLIGGLKCPCSYEMVAALPRDESGKLRRHVVRDGVLAARRDRQS